MTWYWWILLASFLAPAVEALMVALGEWWFHARFRRNPGRFSELIIQVTTTGREEQRVNEIIAEIHAFQLSMPYQIWVVNEPGQRDRYPLADRVITVDPAFESRAQYKARALEYSRLVRLSEGLARDDVKLLFLDDDTSPTAGYITTAFVADYDLCQGITAPRIEYGARPFRHFLLSHMDDMRFLACFIYCSFFQGVLGKPLYVHGEGLCVTGSAEARTTWDYPIFASEDLVFGQNAAFQRRAGRRANSGPPGSALSWGFFHEYIQLTSPWTWSDFLKQRRRWLWGNLHALTHREILPFWGAVLVAGKYVAGFVLYSASIATVALLLLDWIKPPAWVYAWCYGSFVAWLGAFAVSGWINSATPRTRQRSRARYLGHRVLHSVAAVVLCPLTASWAAVSLLIVYFMGNPRSFEVIEKTGPQTRRGSGSDFGAHQQPFEGRPEGDMRERVPV